MPQLGRGLCGKVVEQQYDWVQTVHIAGENKEHKYVHCELIFWLQLTCYTNVLVTSSFVTYTKKEIWPINAQLLLQQLW